MQNYPIPHVLHCDNCSHKVKSPVPIGTTHVKSNLPEPPTLTNKIGKKFKKFETCMHSQGFQAPKSSSQIQIFHKHLDFKLQLYHTIILVLNLLLRELFSQLIASHIKGSNFQDSAFSTSNYGLILKFKYFHTLTSQNKLNDKK